MTAPTVTTPQGPVSQSCTICGRPVLFCICDEARHVDWREQAACRPGVGPEPEVFFPTGTGEPARRQILLAKQWCHTCPVQAVCLQTAMKRGETDGIFGGLTADERAQRRTPPPRTGRGGIRLHDPKPTNRREMIAAILYLARRNYSTARIASRLKCDPALVVQVRRAAE